jgi:hypothetical protein
VTVLSAVEEHARIFHGGGQLAEERDALWIRALLASGRFAKARDRLSRFERRYPKNAQINDFLRAAGSSSPVP